MIAQNTVDRSTKETYLAKTQLHFEKCGLVQNDHTGIDPCDYKKQGAVGPARLPHDLGYNDRRAGIEDVL